MQKSHANGIGIRLTGIGSLATVVVKEVEDISAFMLRCSTIFGSCHPL